MPSTLPALNAGGVVTFTGGTSQVALDPTLTLGDASNQSNQGQNGGPDLVGAIVSIGAGFTAGDTLNFTSQNGIAGSYDASTGVLTLSGTSSQDNYQAALRSISYSFSPSTDDPTEGRTDNERVISWSITDGTHATQQLNAIGGGYAAPEFLAVDANGTVFVTDDGNAPNLTALGLINGSYAHPPTPLPNLLGTPAGIAVDSGGNLFVTANVGPGRVFSDGVEVFAPTYQTANAFFTPATTDLFVGIAVDALGNVFIVDQSTGTITEVTGANFANHNTVFAASPLLMQQGLKLEGIAVDARGNLFVAEHAGGSGDIRELTAASGYQTSLFLGFGSFTAPTGVAIDQHGDLFVTDAATNSVKELLGPAYATVLTIDSTHFLQPTGIALDAHNNVFVADTGHHAVAEITALPTSRLEIAIAPVVSVGANVTVTYNGAPIALDAQLTVSDQASQNLVGATVSIAAGFLAGDQLNFSTQNGITGSYDAVHGVLTLFSASGASLTAFQTALRSITYSFNPGDGDPTGGGTDAARAISWVVDDGGHASSPGTSQLTIVHAPPALAVAGSPTFIQGFAAVPLATSLSVTDPDSGGMLAGATVQITGGTFAADGDILSASTGGTSIAASYNSATETLTLAGSDTLAHYQQVLLSVSFSNVGSDPTHGGGDPSRTVTWTVDDGNTSNHLATATQTVDVVAPPTVTAGASATFTGGSSSVALDPTLSVHETESTILTGAAVSITAGFKLGDTLNFTTQSGITGSYDASHGILALSGTATVAQYQAALQSVSYSFAPTSSDPTAAGSDASRVITWAVNDGIASSTPAVTVASGFVSARHLAIDANGTLYVTSDLNSSHVVQRDGISLIPLVNGIYAAPTAIATDFIHVNGVTVGAGGDVFFTTGNPMGLHDGVLREVVPPSYGPATSLYNAGGSGHFVGVAEDASSDVFVADQEQGIVTELTAASGYTAHRTVYTGNGPTDVVVDAGGNLFVRDGSAIQVLAAASGFTTVKTIDISGLPSVTAFAVDAHGDLFVTDATSGTLVELLGPDYATAVTVASGLNAPDGIALDANGDIFVVESGSGDIKEFRAPAFSTLDIVLAPVVTAGATATFIGGGGAVALDPALTLTDQGSTTLTGATVRIAAGFLAGDTLNFTVPNGITGSYDAVQGVLTLSSPNGAPLGAYEAALQSITYSFATANGDPTGGGTDASRSISWTVTDGTHTGSGTSTLTLVHTAPSITVTASPVFTQSGPPVVLDGAVTVADPDSDDMLAGATVKIVGGALTGDTLAAATGGTSIGASYDSASATLTLAGSDTLAHYQQVLESVTYKSTSGDPTHAGADPTRTIAWTVDDGNSANHLASATQTLTLVPLVQFTSPAISGIAQEGQTLTAPSVGGSGTPGYTWYSSVDNYTAPIGTGPTYLVQEADEQHQIEVSASVIINSVTQTITSLPTDTVVDAAPTVTTPVVTGLEQAGHTLTASASGNNTLGYEWFSSADNFAHAIGSGASYLVQPVDVSHTLAVTATVTNDDGVTAAASALVPPHVDGTPGNDTFAARIGNEFITGHGGTDTVIFDFNLTEAHVSFIGNEVIVDTVTSHTVLNGMSVYKFADGTVNEKASSDPLVDPLFYYSQYHDVWTAGLDAATHYNTVGWHQGRDPDAFFSTSTYLSLNPGVKASGADPLTQFEQGGWKTSDPSINFDINAYLKANPDVAVAGVDPLVHFLQNGEAEGRSPIAPNTLVAPNGFDYVYYLQHNPDVAAAHVDPLQHYETIGWKEGRNPNAYFDTNGYLAHNPDVAAAGVNPLDQYDQFGWKEGRDPSTLFDTKAYLAAYPDVAAAHIDPLVQFLHYGIAEGRTPHGDGLWT